MDFQEKWPEMAIVEKQEKWPAGKWPALKKSIYGTSKMACTL